MAGSGPNYKLAYVYSGRADAWLDIIICLYFLIYSLLYSSVGSLYLLNLVNNIICGLTPGNLVLKSAGGGPNIFLFLLFWRISAVFVDYNAPYIGSSRNILLNIIFELRIILLPGPSRQ